MNYDTLELFLSVADSGSFSKAAVRESLSKQAIAKQINSLEKELQVKLFLRTNHGIALTEAGRAFYQGAQKLAREKNELIASCRQAAAESR